MVARLPVVCFMKLLIVTQHNVVRRAHVARDDAHAQLLFEQENHLLRGWEPSVEEITAGFTELENGNRIALVTANNL